MFLNNFYNETETTTIYLLVWYANRQLLLLLYSTINTNPFQNLPSNSECGHINRRERIYINDHRFYLEQKQQWLQPEIWRGGESKTQRSPSRGRFLGILPRSNHKSTALIYGKCAEVKMNYINIKEGTCCLMFWQYSSLASPSWSPRILSSCLVSSAMGDSDMVGRAGWDG